MQTRTPTQGQRKPSGTAARREQAKAAARQRQIVIAAGVAIVVLIGILVVVRFVGRGSRPAAENTPAPPELVSQIANIDSATFEQVGRGTLTGLPTPVRAPQVETGPSGLPLVTYLGAEYCPFCAAERWALVAALGRFGTFSNLQLSHSASDDVYPNTPTFSFAGSSYSSPYVEFSPVELQSNVRSGNSYQTLQTPTPAQTQVLQKYDAPPYVPRQSAGAIPFVDFGGQYVGSGASYDPSVLRGLTAEQIAASLSDPNTPQAKAILGQANALTAAICSATGNTVAEVCSLPAVASIQATLAATPAPSP
jgi:Domain of unknown function (DUF929)